MTEGDNWYNATKMRVHIEKLGDAYYCGFKRMKNHTRAPEGQSQEIYCNPCWDGYMQEHIRNG